VVRKRVLANASRIHGSRSVVRTAGPVDLTIARAWRLRISYTVARTGSSSRASLQTSIMLTFPDELRENSGGSLSRSRMPDRGERMAWRHTPHRAQTQIHQRHNGNFHIAIAPPD